MPNGTYFVLYLSTEPVNPTTLYWNTTGTVWNNTERTWNFNQEDQTRDQQKEKLLLSKQHTINFEADAVDASVKRPSTKTYPNALVWNTTYSKWNEESKVWNYRGVEVGVGGGDSEIMMGFRSSTFSANGLTQLVVNETDPNNWENQDVEWDSANFNWDVDPDPSGTYEFSVNAELANYVINRTELYFSLVWEDPQLFENTYYTGRCYISNYERVANSEDSFHFNADFKVTSPLVRVLQETWDREDTLWEEADFNWEDH